MGAVKKLYRKTFWTVLVIVFIALILVVGKIIFDSFYPPPKEAKSPVSIQWTQLNSPPGGGIWSITISPSNPEIIYAATRDLNVLKSSNSGESWVQKGERRLGAHIFSTIAVDPNDPNRVYASNGMLHISVNGGDKWEATEIGTGEDLGIVGVAVSFSNPKIIYAHDNNREVHKSIDKGLTWNTINKIKDFPLSNTVLVDPTNSDVIYIVTNINESGVSRIVKSKDGGRTFKTIIERVEQEHIRALVVNQKNPTKLYFASSGGIYRTVDSGSNWDLKKADRVATLAISYSNPEVLLYGNEDGKIYKSTNGGEDWLLVSSIDLHDQEAFAIAIDPTNPDIVYVGTEEGFLKSIDGGMTWKVINNGVIDDGIFTLAVDPRDSNKVYVGNFWTRGVFLTNDGGGAWDLLEEWRHSEVADHYPMEIVIDPRNSNVVYITGEYGFKQTIDGGKTWMALGGNLFYGQHVHGLDIDPLNPDILYVGSGKGEVAVTGAHVFKTTDGGATWEDMANGFPTNEEANVYVISIADSNPSIVYVGTNSHQFVKNPKPTKGLGVYKTADGGRSWRAVNNGLVNGNVFALAVDPKNSNIVYVGTGHEHEHIGEGANDHKDGLYKTIDGGEHWEYVAGLPQAEVSHIEFHPQNSNIILVSFGENNGGGPNPEGRGIYATIDGGGNWYFVSEGFTARQQVVMDVVFDSSGDILYAGTDDGLFKGEIEINR